MEIPDSQLKNLEFLAKLMDDQFEAFGYRFGLNFFVDLLPEIGDLVTTLIALYLVGVALRYNTSKLTIARMLGNIAIYFIVGLIPWIGDIFGAWWKPNKRNIKLLQKKLSPAGQLS